MDAEFGSQFVALIGCLSCPYLNLKYRSGKMVVANLEYCDQQLRVLLQISSESAAKIGRNSTVYMKR